jgi:hypothetical protein
MLRQPEKCRAQPHGGTDEFYAAPSTTVKQPFVCGDSSPLFTQSGFATTPKNV